MENNLVDFVDTGAIYYLGSLERIAFSLNYTSNGGNRKAFYKTFLQPMKCQVGETSLTCSILYMPECPIPFPVQDLLSKLNAQISFSEGKLSLQVLPENGWKLQAFLLALSPSPRDSSPKIPEEIINAVNPLVWAKGEPG